MGGDFVEDGIDFLADEFLGGEVGFVDGLLAGPLVGLAGVDEDFGFSEDVYGWDFRFPIPMAEPADVSPTEEQSTEVGTVSAESSSRSRNQNKQGAEGDSDDEEDAGGKTEDEPKADFLHGVEHGKGSEQPANAGRGADDGGGEIVWDDQ